MAEPEDDEVEFGGEDALPQPEPQAENVDANREETEENGVDNAGASDKQSTAESFIAKKQRLFLVEFLVDTISINPCEFCEETMAGQTCVTLKFLTFPPMNICERDFDPNKDPGMDKIRLNSGKSLMFAFSEKQCEHPPTMMAELVVSKTCPEGSHSEKVNIGKIKICMAQLFHQVYEVAKFTPDKLPASRSIKDCFMLIGRGKRSTGEVGVYIRMTCLGQNVVTEFQCGSKMQDPILFKNREGKKIYQFFDKDKEEQVEEIRDGCGCLRAPAASRSSGGQGDTGRMHRSRPVSSVQPKSGRAVLDVPNKCSGKKDQMKVENCGKNVCAECLKENDEKMNPNENCFVLKVGDKGQIPDRGKMILEFRTPKQRILPKVLPPYHEDIGVQTDSPKKAKGKKKKK